MAAAEIPLAPDAAAVGLDIRVVGNDSGEKVGGRGRRAAGARRHERMDPGSRLLGSAAQHLLPGRSG
jgi:hypothetical protein